MKKVLIVAFVSIFVIVFFQMEVFGEVKIIRKAPPPPPNTNVVHAQWRKPVPIIKEEKPKTVIKGRVEAGGTGGTATDGSSLFNLYTDSDVTVEAPLRFGRVNINGSAYRKSFLQGTQDKYSVGLDLTSELWSFNLGAGYGLSNLSEKNEEGTLIDKNSEDLVFSAAVSTSFIKDFTIKLDYSHRQKKKNENSAYTENVSSNSFELSSSGNLNDLQLEINGSINLKDDYLKSMSTDQYGATVRVGYPISDVLTLSAHMNPNYSNTVYSDSGTEVTSTILDYGTGLSITPTEDLGFQVDMGRIDTWTDSSGGANPVWKAGVSTFYRPGESVKLDAGYTINKVVKGNLRQDMNINANYNGEEESFVQEARAGAFIDYTVDSGGGKVSDNLRWNAGIGILPADRVEVSARYAGGYSEKYELSKGMFLHTWNHETGVKVEHRVTDILMYSARVDFNWYLPQGFNDQVKQAYSLNSEFTPSLGWRTLSISAGEMFSITTTNGADDYSSSFNVGASTEAFKRFNTHYNFGWSWVNLHTADPQNMFTHTVGFSFTGSRRALNISTDYTLQHGDGGVRHQVQSNFYYPFTDSLGLKAWGSYSHYKESGSIKNPFVLGMSCIYLF